MGGHMSTTASGTQEMLNKYLLFYFKGGGYEVRKSSVGDSKKELVSTHL